MRFLLFIFLCFGSWQLKSQSYADILETDSLPSRVVFYLPTADSEKLNLIKTEFAKFPQIENAVYVFGTHHALLIQFAAVPSPKFYTYADVKKQIAHGIAHDEIYMKTPTVYEGILNGNTEGSTTFILK